MSIGVKQILLLRICKDKGHIMIRDVREVYGLPMGRTLEDSNRQSRVAELKLKLLETYGYLKRQNDKYVLTTSGKNEIKEWEKNIHKKIGNNVFLGGGAIVLPGVTIGDNVVIGVGSIVNKDIPSNCVAVGNPAKPVKSIAEYIEDLKDNEIWV